MLLFADILDRCIDHLAGDGTVTECLLRYPEHQEALASDLPVVASVCAVVEALDVPSGAAKARERRRLQQVLAQVDGQ